MYGGLGWRFVRGSRGVVSGARIANAASKLMPALRRVALLRVLRDGGMARERLRAINLLSDTMHGGGNGGFGRDGWRAGRRRLRLLSVKPIAQ